MSKFLGIIPSRIGSTRLPRKPLIDLCGKTLIQRTYESCKKSQLLDDVIVATDSEEIYDHVISFGGQVELTGEHNSGTARIIEIAERHPDYEGYLNIQGDHPLVEIEHIDSLIIKLQELEFADDYQTIVTPVVRLNLNDIEDVNAVKVVVDKYNRALYFSREPIPYVRNTVENHYLKHLGLYGFNKQALHDLKNLPMSMLESVEKLEQLTWLYHGFKIHCIEVSKDVLSIDVEWDVQNVIKSILGKKDI